MAQPLFCNFRLIQAAIATVAILTASPAYSAPNPAPVNTLNPTASTLGDGITPACKDQPFAFPTENCSTGGIPYSDRTDLTEVQRQINDRVQRLRQSAESDKILVPFIQITF